MTQKIKLGQIGEDTACEYLVEKKFKIIERNFKKPWGEIDIIAISPEKVLVFVEVKTMKKYRGGLKPEDHLTKDKLKKLQRTSSLYAGFNQELIKDDKGWRIDLIAIDIPRGYELTKLKEYCVIRHYKNVLA